MPGMRDICGLNSLGRCELLKKSSRGGHPRSGQASLSDPSHISARRFLRSPQRCRLWKQLKSFCAFPSVGRLNNESTVAIGEVRPAPDVK